MILEIVDWVFDIDMERTMEYSAQEAAEHCDCAYCRNFYLAVDGKYPDLRNFLAQFGVDIEAPDESMPFDRPNEMWYENVYTVSGCILKGNEETCLIDGVEVYVYSDNKLHINTGLPEPCFFLGVGMMKLPWMLDEPLEDTVSPANEPTFLKKMLDNLLNRFRDDKLKS